MEYSHWDDSIETDDDSRSLIFILLGENAFVIKLVHYSEEGGVLFFQTFFSLKNFCLKSFEPAHITAFSK